MAKTDSFSKIFTYNNVYPGQVKRRQVISDEDLLPDRLPATQPDPWFA
jgi:hypothetical protein